MCQSCSPASRAVAALTYAIPVDTVSLGASLAAYSEVKPAIHQLRLCHRFGQGPKVHVSKLPQELLDIIVRHAFDLEKLKHVPEWQIKKDCFDGVCCDIDHCTADEIESMKDDIRKNFWMEQDGDELEAIVHDCLIRRMDAMDWYEVCDERKGQWESYTTMDCPDTVCQNPKVSGFAKYEPMLLKDFGLQVFVAKQTVPSKLGVICENSGWRERRPQVTLAFLTVPCERTMHYLTESDSLENDYDYHISSAFAFHGMIDLKTLVLSPGQEQCFRRAMAFFGLSPKLHRVQVMHEHDKDGPILTPEQKQRGAGKEETDAIKSRLAAKIKGCSKQHEESEWPKLMNLVSFKNDLSF